MSRDSTRFVALFQKAHGCIANVQRLDEQIATLFEQRRKALEDLRTVQSQINGEFDRMLELDRVIPADMLAADRTAGSEANGKPGVKEAAAAEPRMAAEGAIPLEPENEPPASRLAPRPFQRPVLEPLKR
jgi:hypothetical protein